MGLRLRLAQQNARFVSKYAVWILLGMALFTALAFPFASRLRLKANLIDLLSSTMPSVQNVDRLTELIGGASYMVAAIESADEETANDVALEFSERAKSFESVDNVDYRTDMSAFEDRKLLFLTKESLNDLDKNVIEIIGHYRRANNPFFIDLLDEEAPELRIDELEIEDRVNAVGSFEAEDGASFMQVVLIRPSHPVSDFTKSEALFNTAQETFDEISRDASEDVTFGITGAYKTRYDEYRVIIQDLKRTGLLTVLVIVVLMMAFFQRRRFVTLAFISLGLGIFWTCAFTQLAIGYLNLISAFLLAILFGLGIAFAIHLLVTFEQERPQAPSTREALEKTFVLIGEPLLTSALTTSIAFFSLTISQFQGFSHFGLIAGVGILACFASIFFGLPSLIVLCERFRKCTWVAPRPRKAKWWEEKAGPIYAVLLAGLIFSGYSVMQIPKVEFEYNFANLQEEGAPSIMLAERIGEYFDVVLNPVALMTTDRTSAFELAQKINQHVETHPDTTFDFAACLFSHVPREQGEKLEILKRIEARFAKRQALIDTLEPDAQDDIAELRHQLQATPFTFEDVPKGMREQYEGAEERVSLVYVYPNASLLDGQTAKRFVRELRAFDLPEGVVLAGEPVLYADILMVLEVDTPRAMLISFGVVVLMLFIHFRRVNHVLWVMAPVCIAFLWMIGMAQIVGFKFNYLNATMLPTILGVGIDNGVHIFHRYKKEKKSTLMDIMAITGKAVIMASITTMAAFACLFLARHRGMASLGEVGLLGFAACLLASVIFIPAIIEFIELKHWHPFSRTDVGERTTV